MVFSPGAIMQKRLRLFFSEDSEDSIVLSMYRFIKRLFDVTASGFALIVLFPIMIIVAVGIEINDPGPVFYVATRIGKDNKEFKMYKFRSMRVTEGQSVQTLRPDEDRIFSWGRVIRKLKLDELPQLFNVLIGDMSVIGPRPVAIDQFELFRTGKYAVTKTVRPGLSGPAALYDYIYGDEYDDADVELYKRLVLPTRRELELVYIKKQGIGFDLKMILWTIWCIVCSVFGKTSQKILDGLIIMANDSTDYEEIELALNTR